MRTSSSSLVLFFAFILVFASMQADAKRLTLEEKQRLKAHHDRKLTTDQEESKPTAVPTAVVNGARDTNDKDAITDQNQGKSGDTEKNTGADNNDENDANPTFGQYGAGSSSDSSPDTHRYYSTGDDRKPGH
ncbi:unnamed protein product [Prunus armeniaca]|uniref:Uncharacterized protein n=1 Tax=Prunus armeniaca TaxID=36596 RepID=A0A6J5W4H7_PRUAR|nr:unnamed protein product [Prunus armeniaca]CAB4293118.1 unnamed protein product [Prunus armeniaca]